MVGCRRRGVAESAIHVDQKSSKQLYRTGTASRVVPGGFGTGAILEIAEHELFFSRCSHKIVDITTRA
jgi:hypothetical protein